MRAEKTISVFLLACVGLLVISGPLYNPVHATASTVGITGAVPLVAFNISVSGIHDTDATLSWNTNGDANSTVEYGPTISYGSVRTDPAMAINHAITLYGLSSGTVCHYRIVSADLFGNRHRSADSQFTTSGTPQEGSIAAETTISTNINGITTQTAGGSQKVILNLSNIPGTVQKSGNTATVQNPGNGWSQMQFLGTGITDMSGNISIDQIQNVQLQSTPVTAALGGNIGTVSAQVSVGLTQMVAGASILQDILQGASSSVKDAFQVAATDDNLNLKAVAYTVEFHDTALLNSMLSGAVKVNMSVDHAWVVANAPNGDINAIRIIRFGDDGTKEVLTTRYLGSQGSTDYFEADSPSGLSIFGIVAIAPGTGGGPGGGGGGGGWSGVTTYILPPERGAAGYITVSTPVTGTGVLTTGPITSSVSGMTDIKSSWSVDITEKPPAGAKFITSIISQPSTATKSAFDTALASHGFQMTALAYVMEVTKSPSVVTGNATIQMDVNRSWVSQHGGVDAVRIIRQGDDGLVQILDTRFSNYNMDTGYMNFKAISLSGLSVYALIAVKAASVMVPTSLVITPIATAAVPMATAVEVTTPPIHVPTGLPMTVLIIAIILIIVTGLILQTRAKRK